MNAKFLLSGLLLVGAMLPAQKMPLPGADERVLQLHDVRDLLRTPDEPEEPPGSEPTCAQRRARLEHLAQLAGAFVDPPLLPDEDVRPLGDGHIVMLARPERQAWLEQLLVVHREAGTVGITLEIRILDVSAAAFAAHFAPLVKDQDPAAPLQLVRPAGAETDRWLEAVLGDARVEAVAVPRLLTWPLRTAEIAVGEQISYVKDFDIDVVQGRPIAHPVTAQIFDGTRITTTCGLAGKEQILVRFELEKNDVAKPIPQLETTLAGRDEKITVDLPAVQRVTLRQTLLLPEGGAAIATAGPPAETGRRLVAIVRAERQPL